MDQSVIKIALRGRVVERGLDSLSRDEIDLVVLKKSIQAAQQDPRIRGIYLDVGCLMAGWSSVEEIRKALLDFKKTGKFIVAYGSYYTQATYYLAALADHIVMHPAGNFHFQGFSWQFIFYKGLLDKIGIEPQVFRTGIYKNAPEIFTRKDLSPESKQQTRLVLDTLYTYYLGQLAAIRGLSVASLKKMADTLAVFLPTEAQTAQLINQVGDHEDTAQWMKERLRAKKKIHYVSYRAYYRSTKKRQNKNAKNQIAVLIASGTIVDSAQGLDQIGADGFIRTLKKIRHDKRVKAIVIRINSPGGGALASERMWKEIVRTKSQKPVVASCSNTAASGGYYLAAACHYIVAHPTTLTGSIGVFFCFFNKNPLRNAIGITTDVVKTNSSADMWSGYRAFREDEKRVIQRQMDKTYATFVRRVANGRNLAIQAVERLASGRVWSGEQAQEEGLVDALGGLEEAIAKAAQLAGMKESYRVTYWPKKKTLWEQITLYRHAFLQSVSKGVLTSLAVYDPELKYIQTLTTMMGIQARMPYMLVD